MNTEIFFDGISPNVSLSATVKKGDDSMDSTSVAGRSEAVPGYEGFMICRWKKYCLF